MNKRPNSISNVVGFKYLLKNMVNSVRKPSKAKYCVKYRIDVPTLVAT